MNHLHLTGLTQGELVSFVEGLGEAPYRGRQIFAALHHRRLRSFDDVTDLPKGLRAKLQEQATASSLAVESRYISEDGTRRYLMKTHDGLPVETVFIPEEYRAANRLLLRAFFNSDACPLV